MSDDDLNGYSSGNGVYGTDRRANSPTRPPDAAPSFNEGLVTEILRSLDKTDDGSKQLKLTSDASSLSAQLLRLFVREAVIRASAEAEARDEDEVSPAHIEAIMAQLLLDF